MYEVQCLFLGRSGVLSLVGQTTPVVLGLGHGVSQVHILLPVLGKVSSTLLVPVSVVNKDTGLLDVAFVVLLLLLGLLFAKFGVLLGSQASRNVGRSGLDLANLELKIQSNDTRAA